MRGILSFVQREFCLEFSPVLTTPDSRFPIPDSLLPTPDSRFPIPDSRFPTPDSRFPIPSKIFYKTFQNML
ncbi:MULTISPECIES: hypothetical protein [Moorena]|uniref:hypothetical protein n=1 Tax=Moorena TaxID=1155738 RepID=UPI001375978A|nr:MULTISPECIES: hypothetical protein [Moorena]